MKRFISLALVLCLLVTSLAMFSSCSSFGKKEVNLSDYKIVAQDDFSRSIKDRIDLFARKLGNRVGHVVKASKESSDEGVDNEDFEILIGDLERTESQKVLNKIKGDGYAICLEGNKIVLVGTTKLLTYNAVCEFMNTYLNDDSKESLLNIKKKTVNDKMEMFDITRRFDIIYSANLDDVSNDGHRTPPENPDAYDYPYVVCRQLKDFFSTSVDLDLFPMPDNNMPVGNEIIVGHTTRPESMQYIRKLDVFDYGFAVYGGKVVVAGLGDSGLRRSAAFFRDILSDCSYKNDKNEKVFRLPANIECIETYTRGDWDVDFPRPEGENIYLSGCLDAEDNSVELYYDGSGISADAYLAYCEKLEGAGYSLYMGSSAEDSIYRTYVNKKEGLSLHVTYAAFKYAAENKLKFDPCIRVVSSPLDSVNLIPESMHTIGKGYTKVTDSSITCMELDYENDRYGTCYIITLEDGSFIIIDAGFYSPLHQKRLKNILDDLYYRSFGHLPTPAQPITIAAWYLTHTHGDHYGNFFEYCKRYGSTFKLESLICNFASDEEGYNCYDPNLTLRDQFNTFKTYVKGVKYYKVHTGQRFFIRNVEFEVLNTHEDIYPNRIHIFNDTSTVCRLTFHNTDGKGNIKGKPTTLLSTGDSQFGVSQFLRATYGPYLASDMVTMAHHGSTGCEIEFYAYTQAKYAMFPCGYYQYEKYVTKGSASNAPYHWRVDHYVAKKLSSVKYIIVSDEFNTCITITENGPDMRLESLFNAGNDGAPIHFGTSVTVK